MMQKEIFRYVHRLFEESRDGELTVGNEDERTGYPVEWDEGTAERLARECDRIVGLMTELAPMYEKLRNDTRQLTAQQLEVWNTYLKPFPKHGLDMKALETVWEKFEAGMGYEVSEEEWKLFDAYNDWYAENALERLPVLNCEPLRLINRARRYGKLLRLNAPSAVVEEEAMRFAEEFVLYHCVKW